MQSIFYNILDRSKKSHRNNQNNNKLITNQRIKIRNNRNNTKNKRNSHIKIYYRIRILQVILFILHVFKNKIIFKNIIYLNY